MEQRKKGLVLGPILQSYPPFLVRQLMVEGIADLRHYMLSRPVITMPFRGEEFRVTSTYDSRADVPWVIYALRLWLADSACLIRSWEEHIAVLQRPEEMARLEADLEAERVELTAEDTREGNSCAGGEPGEPRAARTAKQVLAKQRDELERIRQLTHEVEQGLQAVEAAYPEAVAALDGVAAEIRRKDDEVRKRSTHRNEG